MMNETLIERLEDEGLRRYRPPHFYPRYGLTSGKSTRKKPYVIARKWYGVYLVTLERFEGRSSTKVTDESRGYSKVIAEAKGLDKDEGERMFYEVCEVMREYV